MLKHPIVGIDLDGVVVNFNSRALQILSSYTGVRYEPKQVVDYNYANCLREVTPEMVREMVHQISYEPLFWFRLVERSQEIPALAELCNHYCHVYFITSRWETEDAYRIYQTTLRQTIEWLRIRGIDYSGVIRVDGPNKNDAIKGVGCRYFLDDREETFLSCLEAGIDAYLMDAPYNQNVATDRRIYSVGEYLEIIKQKEGLEP